MFLDADDMISPDYLHNCILTINGHQKIGWVYPDTAKFGTISSFERAPKFRISKMLIENSSVCSSLIRKEAWVRAKGQISKDVIKSVKWFEDWAFWLKLLSHGWYGQPNNSCSLYYRQSMRSMMTRSPELMLASRYLNIRYGILRSPLMVQAKINLMRSMSGSLEHKFIKDSLLGFFTKKVAQAVGINVPSGRLRLREIYAMLFQPSLFVKILTSGTCMPNPCEMSIGLTRPLDVSNNIFKFIFEQFSDQLPISDYLVGHFFMQAGGAEQVLLDISKFISAISPGQNINLTITTHAHNGFLKDKFSPLFKTLISIDEIASTSLGRLLGTWTLICINKPACVFIQSNPHLYVLAPVLKQYFPDIKIVNLIHCQNQGGAPSWFDLADYYKQHIDIRIVISNFNKQLLCERYGEESSKILVLSAEGYLE